MHTVFLTGLLLLIGLGVGELFKKLKLPKITGYLLAGFLLINSSDSLIPDAYLSISQVIITLGLAFISFEIGGHLSKKRLNQLGAPILWITLFASMVPFLLVGLGICILLLIYNGYSHQDMVNIIVPTALFLAALSAPTDPNPILAIVHEYKAKGPLVTSIFGIAALDDLLSILLFITVFSVNKVLVIHPSPEVFPMLGHVFIEIFLSVFIAGILGIATKYACPFLEKETDGVLIIVLFGMLCLIVGLKSFFNIDVVISGMVLGWFIRNFVSNQQRLFSLLERYSEEMILLLFFMLSGLHLKMEGLAGMTPYIAAFIILRGVGKYVGVKMGGFMSNAPESVRKNVFSGLLPQGGIVIGLALLVLQTPEFRTFSPIVFNTVLGATIFHEIIGPIFIQRTLQKSGYISK